MDGSQPEFSPSALGANTALQLLGKAVSVALGLGVVAIMARALGAGGFGEYTTAVTFLQFIGILVDFGLTMTAGRALGEAKHSPERLLSNLLSFRVVTAGLAFALAPAVALFLPYPPTVKFGILITNSAFFLTSFSQCFSAVFQAKLKSGWLVSAELTGRTVLFAGTVLAAAWRLPVAGYLTVLIASSAATAVITLFSAKRLIRFHWLIEREVWGYLWNLTWPAAVTIILNLLYLKLDTLILAAYWPAEAVGIYGAAYKVLEVLLVVPGIIGGLVLPLAARRLAMNDRPGLTSLFHGSLDALLAGGLATVAGSIMVGTPLMTLVAGADFAAAGAVLAVLSLAIAAIFIGNATGYFIFALGKQTRVIPLYAIAAAGALIMYFVFIPRYSYWAAAWATVAVEVAMAAGSLWLLRRWGLTPSPRRWPKLILATLALCLGLALPVTLIIKIVLGSALWLGALWYLKLLPHRQELTH